MRDQDSQMVPISDWLWGECYGASISDTLVFVVNGYLFQVLNVAKIDSPHVIAQFTSSSFLKDVVVRDSLAFVIASNDLLIFNVSNPYSILSLASIHVTNYSNWKIHVVGRYAYIADFYGIRIVDISDPFSPVISGYIPTGEETMDFVASSASKLYVGYFDINGLDVFDVSNPNAPAWDTSVATELASPAILIRDTLLYISGFPFGAYPFLLKIYGISTSNEPSLLGVDTVSLRARQNYALSLDTSNNIAYASSGYDGVFSIDVSNVRAPRTLSNIKRIQATHPVRISCSGNRVIVPSISGVWFIDAMRPDSLLEGAYFVTGETTMDFVLAGKYAILSQYDAGIIVLDLSDPAHPNRVSATQLPYDGAAGSVDLLGTYLYVQKLAGNSYFGPDSLMIFDITDPLRPLFVRSLSVQQIGRIKSTPGRLYISQPDSGLNLFSLSDPSNPIRVGRYGGSIGPFSVQEPIAAVVDTGGITVVRTADSSDLHAGSSVLGSGYGVLLKDTLMYAGILNDSGQFSVYSVSTPTFPKLLSSADLSLYSISTLPLDESGGFVYVGPKVLNVANPGHCFVVDSVNYNGYVSGLKAKNDLIYFVDYAGFHVVRNARINSVRETGVPIPTDFELWQNYPNPFNASTIIRYMLTRAEKIQLKVYDLIGRDIATLVDGVENAGSHEATWTALSLPSGVYFYTLRIKSFQATKCMIYLK